MFGKKTIEIGGINFVVNEGTVRDLAQRLVVLQDKLQGERDAIQGRLDAANAKLKDYGHNGGF